MLVTPGDGSGAVAGVLEALGEGLWSVRFTHGYGQVGAYTATVAVTGPGGLEHDVTSTLEVGQLYAGVQGSLEVGYFNVNDSSAVAGDYTAVIQWGDGASSSGTVSGSGGVFSVVGTHSYAVDSIDLANSAYAVSVTLYRGGQAVLSATRGVVVVRPPVVLEVAQLVEDDDGTVPSQVVAAFSEPDLADGASEFTATVFWGDGSSSAGTVTGSNGLFSVTAGHSYAVPGDYVVQVEIDQAWDDRKKVDRKAVPVKRAPLPAGQNLAAAAVVFERMLNSPRDAVRINKETRLLPEQYLWLVDSARYEAEYASKTKAGKTFWIQKVEGKYKVVDLAGLRELLAFPRQVAMAQSLAKAEREKWGKAADRGQKAADELSRQRARYPLTMAEKEEYALDALELAQELIEEGKLDYNGAHDSRVKYHARILQLGTEYLIYLDMGPAPGNPKLRVAAFVLAEKVDNPEARRLASILLPRNKQEWEDSKRRLTVPGSLLQVSSVKIVLVGTKGSRYETAKSAWDTELDLVRDIRRGERYTDYMHLSELLPLAGTAYKVHDIKWKLENGKEVTLVEYGEAGLSFAGDVSIVGGPILKGVDVVAKAAKYQRLARLARAMNAVERTRVGTRLMRLNRQTAFRRLLVVTKGDSARLRVRIALSTGELGAAAGYEGTVDELLASLKARCAALSGADRAEFEVIYNRLSVLRENIHLLDDAAFEAVLRRYGERSTSARAVYADATIYLRKSRGLDDLLVDVIHEGRHAADFAPNGIYRGIAPSQMSPQQIFERERRAYLAERLVTGKVPFGSEQALEEYIIRVYGARTP